MSADDERDEAPEDDEPTRIVVRGGDDDHTRIVARAVHEDHTRIVQRRPAAAVPTTVDNDDTRLVSRADGSDGVEGAPGTLSAPPTPAGRFMPPSVGSGGTDSYRVRKAPVGAPPLNRFSPEPTPTGALSASPAQIRAAAATRMRRRRWLTLAVVVASTILVGAAALAAIIALTGA